MTSIWQGFQQTEHSISWMATIGLGGAGPHSVVRILPAVSLPLSPVSVVTGRRALVVERNLSKEEKPKPHGE